MVKVTVCGAAGGIGQPLSLLLKINPNVDELSLFDVVNVPGVGADLSHINSDSATASFLPSSREDKTALAESLKGTDLVIIPAGVPRKPGMTRDDLFNINAGIIKGLAEGIAEHAPKAFVLVISNPVNSTVPIVAETLKQKGVYDPKRLFGVTTLDIVRANTFIAQAGKAKASQFNVNVIGGHSGETIVPLYSIGASKSYYEKLSAEEQKALIHRVQFGGDEVVQAKNGAGSATLSMAYAGYRLAESILKALTSSEEVVECTFLDLDSSIKGAAEAKKLVKGLDFFSLPVKLGKAGIEEVKYDVLNQVSDDEKKLLEVAIDQLSKNIEKGVAFAQK
ncbi:malate dehydrogenase [Suhomyces tanzawaensis NRRL Y-17324]|uniref:Malate dehydrogenase n=1 Tax=Suhomyces tanzawaensis NRRL Y-17324 TaxID=984487 RepID=A0A1E4SFB5_9ASCO|nr:malate dehydrogenase [Suhomyces tanzawaensis NRRL Y-17324]ODV78166.1 malate dehydrogenase [Suhomyces tanzawaensis NRRL Y-17324]